METTSSPGIERMPSFNPTRLSLARERAGLTKQKLAELCGVTRRTVSLWEAGEVESPPVDKLAHLLGFPPDFFYADDTPEVRPDWISFRALSSMTARQVTRVVSASRLAVEFDHWIEQRYRTASPDIPDIPEMAMASPALMAENLRSAWELYERPVKSMLDLLERKGVRVFSLPRQDREVDAFSFHREGRSYIFLNTGKTAERMRFDLAHELGHLVMHKHGRKNLSKGVEQEANEFAASFLMPADAVNLQVVGRLRLEDIYKLKKYWRVSALAMVERLWQLQHITDWTRRRWIIEFGRRGYRDSEPIGIHPEASKFFTQLFRLTREDGRTLKSIASELRVHPKHIDDCVFSLAMSILPGAGEHAEPPRSGHLRRVK